MQCTQESNSVQPRSAGVTLSPGTLTLKSSANRKTISMPMKLTREARPAPGRTSPRRGISAAPNDRAKAVPHRMAPTMTHMRGSPGMSWRSGRMNMVTVGQIRPTASTTTNAVKRERMRTGFISCTAFSSAGAGGGAGVPSNGGGR